MDPTFLQLVQESEDFLSKALRNCIRTCRLNDSPCDFRRTSWWCPTDLVHPIWTALAELLPHGWIEDRWTIPSQLRPKKAEATIRLTGVRLQTRLQSVHVLLNSLREGSKSKLDAARTRFYEALGSPLPRPAAITSRHVHTA